MKKMTPWMIIIGVLALLSMAALMVLFGRQMLVPESAAPAAQVFIPPAEHQYPTPTHFSPTTPTPTLLPPAVWLDPALPADFRDGIKIPAGILLSEDPDRAVIHLSLGEENPVRRWVYALAAPFPTVTDGFSRQELETAWQGDPPADFQGSPLLLTEDTLAVFQALWGEPADGAVKVAAAEDLSELAWAERPSWALLPFEELDPSWKVLAVDGVSPLDKDFQAAGYPLAVSISLAGDLPGGMILAPSNRDPEKLTTVMLTGVTALVRATAWTMEMEGLEYPARDIQDWLVTADILHISNEVPFVRGCPYPNPSQSDLKFCSHPKYIRLLETIGTDVVELTGDHFGDYGPLAMLNTLELYDLREWPYYGGGATRQEAQQPVLFEHNGNRIAFLGCNAKGGGYATAGPDQPGAVACDFDQITAAVEDLTRQGYLVIGTFQHFEYYTYAAQPDQIRDAARLTDAGAVIVSGSQAHQPQGFEIKEGAFVHHGLGNLFFDQIYEIPPNTATAFIDRHVFYDGRHISTELLTIRFEDYARARPMTTQERETLLETVFRASGW